MDDLKEHLSRQNAFEREWRLQCFDELYAKMHEMKQLEMRPTSSIQDPNSPRESESIASMTPTGEYARGKFSFRDQPLSTTNMGGGRFDLSTPKGGMTGGFDLGQAVP